MYYELIFTEKLWWVVQDIVVMVLILSGICFCIEQLFQKFFSKKGR